MYRQYMAADPVGVRAPEFDWGRFEKRSEAKRQAKRSDNEVKRSESEPESNASRNEATD